MSIENIIGWVLAAILAAAYYTGMIYLIGLKETLILISMSLVLIGFIWVMIYLITQ